MNLQNSKEQFLRTLNLVATRNIKVKYCRTIKERLRPKTQEENLSLPSQSKFKSPTKKKSDDLKPVGSLSPEKPVKNVLQHDDGVAFIKSYKNRKKSRKKSFTNVISPPSSKSLLSYLHQNRSLDHDSSCNESDSSETVSETNVKAVNLSNGFSRESANTSLNKIRSLKDLISGLETEEEEVIVKQEKADIEVVEESKDVVMQMVEDFSLMSESDSEDESASKLMSPQFMTPAKPRTAQVEDREVSATVTSNEDILLREMLKRYQKLDEGKAENKFLDKYSDPKLHKLVSRVRRETKVQRKIRQQSKIKTRGRRKILSRYNYTTNVMSAASKEPPYACKFLAKDQVVIELGTKPKFSRLEGPSTEDIAEARKINKIGNITFKDCQNENSSATKSDSENLTSNDPESSIESSVNSSQDDQTEGDNIEEEEELIEEIVMYDGDQSKSFKCKTCWKVFSTKNGLDYHERVHSGVSPYTCDICNKKFKSSSLCSRHKQIHAKDKKYLCNVCSKTFAQKSNLSKHMDIHDGVKPYQCPSCSKSFTQKVHLDCHIMTHSKHRPWECRHCGNRFSKKSSLSRHVQSIHETEGSTNSNLHETDKVISDATALLEESKDITQNFSKLNGDNFDVEVSYCDNVEMMDVDNQTYFIIDQNFGSQTSSSDVDRTIEELTKEDEPAPGEITYTKSLSENAEQIEDIQAFLKDSAQVNLDSQHNECPSKSNNIEFTKESALKIISQSSIFVNNKLKNDLSGKKVVSFEEALNAATSVPKKPLRAIAPKPPKVEAQKPKPPSPVKSSKGSDAKVSKPSTTLSQVKSIQKLRTKSRSADVVSKIIASQSKSTPSTSEKKPVIKSMFSSSSTSKSDIKLEKKDQPKADIKVSEDKKKVKPFQIETEEQYQMLFAALRKTLLDNNIKPVPSISPGRSYNQDEGGSSSSRTESQGYYTSSSKTSPSKDSAPSSSCTSTSSNINQGSSRNTKASYSSQNNDGDSWSRYVKTESDTSCDGQVKTNTQVKVATMLPTVFPTFDQQQPAIPPIPAMPQRSFSNMSSIMGSKPTAVVPPSTRSKMPALPKPVPAAIGGLNDLDFNEKKAVNVRTSFTCNTCGENFNAKSNLISHQQLNHYY